MIARNPNEKKETNVKPVLIRALAFLIIGGVIGGTIFFAGKGKKTTSTSDNEIATETNATIAEGIGTETSTSTPSDATPTDGVPVDTDFIASIDPNATDIRNLLTDTTPITGTNFDSRFPSNEDDQNTVEEYVTELTDGQIFQIFAFLAAVDDIHSSEDFQFMHDYYMALIGNGTIDPSEMYQSVPVPYAKHSDGIEISKAALAAYFPYYVSQHLRDGDVSIYSCIGDLKNYTNTTIPLISGIVDSLSTTEDYCNSIPMFYSMLEACNSYSDGSASSHNFNFGVPGSVAAGEIPSYVTAGQDIAYVVPVKDTVTGTNIYAIFNNSNDLIGFYIL